jgi:hypothetical protein
MIAEEVRILDIDPAHWANLIGLIAEREVALPLRAPTFALVLTRDGQAVKAIHSARGVVRGYRLPASGKAADVAKDLGADRVAVFDVDLFSRIFDAGQRTLAFGADLADQVAAMWNAGSAAARAEIAWHPGPPIDGRPIVVPRIRRWLARVWPDGRTVVFAVFDEGTVHTSLILGKQEGRVELVTTLAGIDTTGLVPSRWRTEHRAILARVAKAHGRPVLGLFLSRRTFQEMRAGRRPLRYLLEAHRRGTAVIAPFPFRLRVLLRLATEFGLG